MRGTTTFSARVSLFILCFMITAAFFLVDSKVSAAGCSCGGVSSIVSNAHSTTRSQVCDCYKSRMDDHEKWILEEFWPLMEHALKGSASQQTQGQATQLQAQGMMHDANNHVATQRAREQEVVQTVRRFGGAEYAVCTPASIGQGAIASRELARGVASTIAKSLAKNGSGSTSGRSFNGPADDRAKRFSQIAAEYCAADDFGGIGSLVGCAAGEDTAYLDISFTEIFNGRDVNGDSKIDASDFFQGTTDDGTEQSAWDAFNSNIGLQRPFTNIRKDRASSNRASVIQIMMAMRQYMARRSVATNSFVTFQSLTMPGSAAATEYLQGLYSEMGRDPSVIPANPSSYQQEKIIYYDYHMDPNLYIQDYTDSPEQLQRHQALALSHINAQLFRITEVLRRIDMGIAGLSVKSLDEEYNAIQGAINSVNTAQ